MQYSYPSISALHIATFLCTKRTACASTHPVSRQPKHNHNSKEGKTGLLPFFNNPLVYVTSLNRGTYHIIVPYAQVYSTH